MDILIDLIVTDLPIMVQDRIDKTEVASMEDLLAELQKLEGLVQRKKTFFHANASRSGDQPTT